MSEPRRQSFPRAALLGAAALVGFALASAALARISGVGTMETPVPAPVESRDLRFEDRLDGAVAITDAVDGREVAVLAPGSNGFIRGTMRGLARERKRQEIGREPPFRLARAADGRLSIEDPTTGRRIDLGAFGHTNAGAFARLLETRSETP